jgi:hypothetical protein
MSVEELNEQYRRLSMVFVNGYASLSERDEFVIKRRLARIRRRLDFTYGGGRWLS